MSKKIVLLDFDGVIVDTEPIYTEFWNKIGEDYLNDPQFAYKIKGQVLTLIMSKYFPDPKDKEEIYYKIDRFEETMPYNYIPGALEFLQFLHDQHIKSAIVTSSNTLKMNHVYKVHPELTKLVDKIFTAEDFSKSKPDPDCFLKGIEFFGSSPKDTVIFEDSYHGLAAARATGATVVALSTTNPLESLIGKADIVIPDFINLSFITKIV